MYARCLFRSHLILLDRDLIIYRTQSSFQPIKLSTTQRLFLQFRSYFLMRHFATTMLLSYERNGDSFVSPDLVSLKLLSMHSISLYIYIYISVGHILTLLELVPPSDFVIVVVFIDKFYDGHPHGGFPFLSVFLHVSVFNSIPRHNIT